MGVLKSENEYDKEPRDPLHRYVEPSQIHGLGNTFEVLERLGFTQ